MADEDKEIRRYLLENAKLEAVVSMLAGVFQPYAGVKKASWSLKENHRRNWMKKSRFGFSI